MSSSPLSGPRNRRVVPICLWVGLVGAAALAAVGCATNVVDDSGTTNPTVVDSGGYSFETGTWLGQDDDAGSGNQGDDSSSPPPPPPPPPSKDGGSQPDAGSDSAPPGAIKPVAGDLLITEVMYDPSGTEPDQEWFELYNTTNGARDLTGLTLIDGAQRTHTLASLTIDSGKYLLLVRNKTAATGAGIGAAAIGYEYGAGQAASQGIILANGSTGAIALRDGSTDLVRANYGAWNVATGGHSIQLKSLAGGEATTSAGWCNSPNAWPGGTDKGTPALAGDCP
jgi:hypothetical protein